MLPCVITTLKVKVYTGKSDLLRIIFLLLSVKQFKKIKSCVSKRRAHRARVDKLHGHS